MNTPLYQTVYTEIKNKIETGHYKVDEQLPTDKEFTEIYNVSNITIKRAMDLLKDEGLVSRKPRKGTQVIKQYANAPTITTTTNSLPTFGLVLTNFDDVFGAQILRSVISNSYQKAEIIVKLTYGDSAVENEIITDLVDSGVNGIILLPSSSQYVAPKILELSSKNFPLVVIDRLMPSLPVCSVETDSQEASKTLTKYLFDEGHKNIGIITSDSQVTTIDERVNGFISAHLEQNYPISQNQILSSVDSVVPNSKTPITQDIEIIRSFLNDHKEVTAIITTEYNIALLVKSAISLDNKKIPEDLSLACFDHPEISIFDKTAFTITHIKQKQEKIGFEALNLLFKKIEDNTFVEKVMLGFELRHGHSINKIN